MDTRVSPHPPQASAFSLDFDAFLLDVDGTILDIAPTPDAVLVPESLKQTLARLQMETAGAIALVSGRELATLDSLFAPLALASVGCHGAEWRIRADGPIAFRSRPLSSEVKQTFLSAVADMPRIRIEDKGYTLAFHYRAAPELGPELEARLVQVIAPYTPGLRLLHGKLVLEVKPGSFDKGEAIRALMEHAPFAGRRPVFLGDDTTDQDAFTALRGLGGIGISVGRPMDDAACMLDDPRAARDWLAVLSNGDLRPSLS